MTQRTPDRDDDRTVVTVGETAVEVTLDDARAMRDALLAYLGRSGDEDRERLAGWARGGVHIESDGVVCLGPWQLSGEGDGLVLRFREPPGPHYGRTHVASVVKDAEGWAVTDLVTERIRPRR